jgi:hypothetical protein
MFDPHAVKKMRSAQTQDTYIGVETGKGAQPQVSGSETRLKKLFIKLETPNSPSTILCLLEQ